MSLTAAEKKKRIEENRAKQTRVDYTPRAWQREVHAHPARFRIVICGRQIGKTTLAIHECTSRAYNNPNQLIYWVAPTFSDTNKAYEKFKLYYPLPMRRAMGLTVVKNEVRFSNGSRICFRGAHEPDRLVGDTLDFLVIDEAALISDSNVFYKCLFPALSVKKAPALIISTPRSKNWVYTIYQLGLDPTKEEHYKSFRVPVTTESSDLTQEEIDFARNMDEMTEDRYRTEFLAEFLTDSGSVFRNYLACMGPKLTNTYKINSSHRYVIGVDIGRSRDFTVIMVMDIDANNEIVYMDRFNGVDWPVVQQRIVACARRFRAIRTLVDSTGVGDAFHRYVKEQLPNCEGYSMHSLQAKNALIENLISGIERKDLIIPNEETLLRELSDYEFDFTSQGNKRYAAAKSRHDDCVIALALCYWMVREKPVKQLTSYQAKLVRRRF